MNEFTIILGFIAIVFISTIIAAIHSIFTMDRKEWNNGRCPHCDEGLYESIRIDSKGRVLYKCTSCKNTLWRKL